MLKRLFIGVLTLTLLLGGSFAWFVSLIDRNQITPQIKATLPEQLPYLASSAEPGRGRILAVVTSTDVMGKSGKDTGYELTELARSYYVFQANGFDVDIASIQGGEPPVVLDDEDMGAYDYAFLNDPSAQNKVTNSLAIADVRPEDYRAVYFVGGKGAMFDFPDNPHVQALVRYQIEQQGVVGAVCHGPAALVNVTLSDGSALVANKQVSSFTNSEELFLIPDAQEIFPFLLQSKLEAQGADFMAGNNYLKKTSVDGNLVTGQNPWSVWQMAEDMVRQLGYEPKVRAVTAEEHSIEVLGRYAESGFDGAAALLDNLQTLNEPVNRNLFAMHGILAMMQGSPIKSMALIRLTARAKANQP